MNSIKTYIKKIHSALQGSGSVRVSSFIDEHIGLHPLLHPLAGNKEIDFGALNYSMQRLPAEIFECKSIILAPLDKIFIKHGYQIYDNDWYKPKTTARHQKRKYHAQTQTMAVSINSISDVEDSITMVTALYIECLKISKALKINKASLEKILGKENFLNIKNFLGKNFNKFAEYVKNPYDFEYTLLSGSYLDFSRAVQNWWIDIVRATKKYNYDVSEQPIYFISSNDHSILNLLSGYPLLKKEELFKKYAKLIEKEAKEMKQEKIPTENLCYFLSHIYEEENQKYHEEKSSHETNHGLIYMKPKHDVDIYAQVFSLKDVLKNQEFDQRLALNSRKPEKLKKSNALIFNINYPLGMGAYSTLREVSENIAELRGLYIIGKAASLNASIGDISIPSFVQEMHTLNSIYFDNIFNVSSFEKLLNKQSIFAEQKANTVRGTFLQNYTQMMKNFDDGFTIFEMELGPYLNRIYELIYPQRHPENETFVLKPNFRLGVAYYVSDTPHKKGKNLGNSSKWKSINSTYALSIGILNDIFDTEYQRLK